jgi:AraC-like DNA-binding protein
LPAALSADVGTAGTVGTPAFTQLIRTYDPQEFMAAPVGRCIIGSSFAIWCHSPELQGSILWGKLDDQSIREMFEIGQFVERHEFTRRRTITDCRDLDQTDGEVLLSFIASARYRIATKSSRFERQALIVPAGIDGVLISGTLSAAGAEHPLRVVHDLEAAFDFIDHPAAAPAYASATALVADTRGNALLLSRLRLQLNRDLRAATIEESAAALGMSTRTLQRELQRLDTSFSKELLRARLVSAEGLLVHSELKIESIATQVGFGTASRMSASLRRTKKMTASQLRAQRSAKR